MTRPDNGLTALTRVKARNTVTAFSRLPSLRFGSGHSGENFGDVQYPRLIVTAAA